MNKKIIITICILFLLLIGTIVYALVSQNKSSGSQPSLSTNTSTPTSTTAYILSIDAFQKSISGNLTINSNTSALDSNSLAQYALINVNQTGDLLSFFCASPYKPSDPKSSTGNNITTVAALNEVTMGIFSGIHNNLTVNCSK